MKKHFILAVMAMSALFSACNNEDPIEQEKENVPVSFVIAGIDSRATTAADFTTTFENGDAIGIFSGTGVTPVMSNVQYNVSVSGNEATIAPAESSDFAYSGNAVFNAYYPWVEGFDGTFSVQANQSSGIATSDFLTATATGSKETPTVTLDFDHRLTLVQVKLTGLTEVSSVTLKNAQTNISFANSTDGESQGAVTLVTEDKVVSDIIMYPQTADVTYWAIIPAQSIVAGNLFVVTTSNGTYSYKTTAATTFTEGTIAKYSLTLQSDEPEEDATLVNYSPVKVNSWKTENVTEIEGNLEEDKFIIKDLYSSNTEFKTGSVTGYSETPTWYSQSSSAKITTMDNLDVIQLTAATNAGGWYNNGIAYCAGNSNMLSPNKTYKLSFYAKASAATSLKIWCGNKADGSNSFVYKISGVDGATLKTFNNITTEWAKFEVSFDPSMTFNAASTGKTLISNDKEMPFNIVFWPGGTSTAATDEAAQVDLNYYIHSISFEEE